MSTLSDLNALIAEAVFDRKSEKRDYSEEELKRIYALARRHDVHQIAAYALKNKGALCSNSVSQSFLKGMILASINCEKQMAALKEIEGELNKNNIRFIPLKGSVIRDKYPLPWLRTSCDIDILVHESDSLLAAKILEQNLKYKISGTQSHDVQLFSPSGVHVELHFKLIEDGRFGVFEGLEEQMWSSCRGGNSVDDAMFYYYHVAHMAKHFAVTGCGIRSYIDLFLLINKTRPDKDKLALLLKKGGLVKFEAASRQLANVWYGLAEHTEITGAMEKYILHSATYGSVENNVGIIREKNNGSIFKYVLSRLRLKYDIIKYEFPILKKHRWLTPLFQAVRIVKRIFSKKAPRYMQELKQTLKSIERDDLSILVKELDIK